jgi:hypothetical protein
MYLVSMAWAVDIGLNNLVDMGRRYILRHESNSKNYDRVQFKGRFETILVFASLSWTRTHSMKSFVLNNLVLRLILNTASNYFTLAHCPGRL